MFRLMVADFDSPSYFVAIAAVAQMSALVLGLNGFTRMRSDRASPHYPCLCRWTAAAAGGAARGEWRKR